MKSSIIDVPRKYTEEDLFGINKYQEALIEFINLTNTYIPNEETIIAKDMLGIALLRYGQGPPVQIFVSLTSKTTIVEKKAQQERLGIAFKNCIFDILKQPSDERRLLNQVVNCFQKLYLGHSETTVVGFRECVLLLGIAFKNCIFDILKQH